MFGNGGRGSREQLEHRKDGIRCLKEKEKRKREGINGQPKGISVLV